MSGKQETNKKRIGLGRGLGALLEDSENLQSSARQGSDSLGGLDGVNLMEEIPLEFIETNPYQPREHFEQSALQDLAESIRIQGIIQPITVRKVAPRKFQLISGERRLQASKIAGLVRIPAYVRTADDQQMIEMALIENIQRENLNAIEIALSYKRLMDECNLRQEDLGSRVGKNRSTVTNYMRLLKLPPHIQVAIRDSKISMGHARCLISVENSEVQQQLYLKTISEEWSVRRLEDAVRQSAAPAIDTPTGGTSKVDASELRQWQSTLTDFFHAPVSLKMNEQGKGEMKISFKSKEDLMKLLEAIRS
ncbi:ParB/RepB/Spo0J family partition protein [Aquirufa sp.]|jgi:ParB family transcriptional regulator, chromosome partitioning protein|uniref:ParB/RepB/Spo0J family partition protein n=1 Tax=Aquirufa sp. TaxID=2676249 RepID=UPI0037C12A05